LNFQPKEIILKLENEVLVNSKDWTVL